MSSSHTSFSNTQFAAMSQFFEQHQQDPSYSVYEITKSGQVNTSSFTSSSQAFEYARNFTGEQSQVFVYKTKCIKIFDPVESEAQLQQNLNLLIEAAETLDTDPEYVPSGDETDDDMPHLIEHHDLSGLVFSEYGKGYLLHPNDTTTFTGVKYLHDGWWNASQNGWFFRRQHYDDLIAAGATYSSASDSKSSRSRSTRSSNSSKSSRSQTTSTRVGPSPFEIERDLSGFAIEPYGKGVLLSCSRSNKLCKQKTPYLLGNMGWWNNAERGWFFKNQYVSELERLGAKRIKQEPGVSTSASTSTSKKSSKKSSTSTSTTRRVTRSSPTSSPHFVTDDSQFFQCQDNSVNFEPYGRGWLLRESDTYTYKDNGKYFQGGFWMPQNRGWFFRNNDKESFTV